MKQLKIGTRGSKLALWQARKVQEMLLNAGILAELVKITTTGDQIQDVPLHEIGTTGIFTKALDQALLQGEIDLAVHSAKDMPSVPPEGLHLAALLKREDPRDVLLASSSQVSLENLSRPWVIGTSSVRRRALLQHHFSHVQVKDIRGNLDTRLGKMLDGAYDGIMLAYAGVKRMGFEKYIVQKLNAASFTPAVGQGAVAVVTREKDENIPALRTALHHPETGYAVASERAYLHAVDGGCHSPVFGLATVVGSQISLTAGMANPDGKRILRFTGEGNVSEAEKIGQQLAKQVLESVNNN
jgi:hydroxymethylbilane synthase